MKGGVTYLSDVITAITSMFSNLFMLFIAALVVFFVNANITSNVYGDVLYNTPYSDIALNAILDSQYEGFQIKDLLAFSTWLGSETFDYGNKKIELKKAISSTATKLGVGEYTATLTLGGKTIELAKAGVKEKKSLKCSEHKIFADTKLGSLTFCASRIGG